MGLFDKIQSTLSAPAEVAPPPVAIKPVPKKEESAILRTPPTAPVATALPAAEDKIIDIDVRNEFIRRLNTAGFDGIAQIEAYRQMAAGGMNTVTLYAAVKELYQYTPEQAIAKYGVTEEKVFRSAAEWRALSKQKRFIKSHAAEAQAV